MKALRIAPAARRDLASIWNYTAETWGDGQAETYLAMLHRDMLRLRMHPEIGAGHPTRMADFRKLPSGHHFIFYLVGVDAVDVIRVLHERMDVNRQLAGER